MNNLKLTSIVLKQNVECSCWVEMVGLSIMLIFIVPGRIKFESNIEFKYSQKITNHKIRENGISGAAGEALLLII